MFSEPICQSNCWDNTNLWDFISWKDWKWSRTWGKMVHFRGKMKTSRHHFRLEINTLRMALKQQGKRVGEDSAPPTKPSGFTTQTKPFLSAGQQELTGVILWATGPGPHDQRLPFRDAREKGPGRGPRPLFSFSRVTGCLLDTRLADGISKVFQEPSGVGTIITNHTSNKARRVTSWQKRSKTNSTMFLRDSVFKKKNQQADKWRLLTAYYTVFCWSS